MDQTILLGKKRKKLNLFDGLAIPVKLAPVHSIICIIHRLLSSFVPAVTVLATASFINGAIDILAEGKPLNIVFLPILYVGLVIAWSILSDSIIQFVKVKFIIKLREKSRILLTEKRAKLNYRHIENKDTWDLITRVSENPEDRLYKIFNDILSMVSLFISIISVLSILILHVWWAGIVIVLVSVPLFFIAIKSGRESYKKNREVTKIQRKYMYLSTVLTGRESVLERSLFGYTKKLNEKWKDEYENARIIEYKTMKKWFIRMKSGSVLTAMISIFIVFILINPVITGAISIGIFISLVNASIRLISTMSWEFTHYTDMLAKHREFIKDFSDFIVLDEQYDALSLPYIPSEFKSLEFKDVYFKYPGTENYILKGMSFRINKGEHYSFVGVNGAGKTTITKLLTGLYSDYEGEILLNGIDLKEYALSQLKGNFSALFQDFSRYSISIKDNITIGNVKNNSKMDLDNILNLTGLNEVIANLSEGINTELGKIKKNGIDISGGEWQKIAMARSLINPAPIKILDEPTASLDPISESNIYEKFEEISKGYTTIFISHRLGSTKFSDVIFVIDDGKIIETGSHDFLMKENGMYSKMFESQRSWYA